VSRNPTPPQPAQQSHTNTTTHSEMRLSRTLACLVLATHINGASLPETSDALNIFETHAGSVPRSSDIVAPDHSLERRKGGGGRGGGSSGGGSSSSSGGGGSRSSGSSMVGGATRSGSGPSRSYGRGGYYGGGAATPYAAGSRTPKGLIAGVLIAPLLILAIMPGLWLYSVYPYYYNNPYRFYNQSAVNQTYPNGYNTSLPVMCLCQEFAVCGCDENTDQQYINDLVGNGSYQALNKTLVTVSNVNGTNTLVLNGSLPNGTTAPGGTDDAAASLAVGKYAGYWVMGLIVLYGVFM
jgi:hypothetical protein